jgi:threonine dehydratase
MHAPAIPSEPDIRRAARLLEGYLPVTRMEAAPPPAGVAADLRLKLEQELPTGSFKVRGALVALHAAMQSAGGEFGGVVAASTGNHGAAVAWAARVLGVPAIIFLPAMPNPVKRSRILEHGARVVEAGPDITSARVAADAYAAEHGAFVLDDATDPNLPAGPGTIGAEIMAQCPDAAMVLVSVGDTALIRGVAAAVKGVRPDVRVVGVQAETADAYAASWRSGVATATADCDTIADGLATRVPEQANVDAIRQLVDDVVTVSDDAMLRAMRHLLVAAYVHAEPSASAAVAALHHPEVARHAAAGPVVAVITGCNTPPHLLARLLQP